MEFLHKNSLIWRSQALCKGHKLSMLREEQASFALATGFHIDQTHDQIEDLLDLLPLIMHLKSWFLPLIITVGVQSWVTSTMCSQILR